MKKIFLLLLLVVFFSGCVFDSDDDNEIKDAGSYTISVTRSAQPHYMSQVEIESCPGSAYIVFISIEPDEAFAGTVELSVEDPLCLHPQFYEKTLTKENTFTELTIYPDSTMEYDTTYELTVTATHADSVIKENIFVTRSYEGFTAIVENREFHLYPFIDWLHENYPSIPIDTSDNWSGYLTDPLNVGGHHIINFTDNWIVDILLYVLPTEFYFLLHQRGEEEPLIAVYNDGNETWTELSVQDWDNRFEPVQ